MRKIGSERDSEEKRKRNVKIIGMFILIVLVLGTIGYGFLSSGGGNDADASQDIEEGRVVNQNGRWTANMNGQTLYFINSPESVENISVEGIIDINDYSGKNVYISSENQAVTNEIALNLGGISTLREACYGYCERDLPEKNCTEYLIVWKDSLVNKVYREENCIFIEGDLKAVDAFVYRLFGLN